MNPTGAGIFEFETMMTTVQAGMSTKLIPAIVTVAYVLMAISVLLAIYEAFAKGGDTRQLAAALFKYIVVAFVIGNWSAFFLDMKSGFDSIAQYIGGSYGAGDLSKDWQQQLSTNFNAQGYQSIWNIIIGGGAAIFNALEIAVAYIVFPLAVQIFTLLYVFWGAVLYAIGPLVLALGSSQMVNSTAKFFARNLVVWNCWPIIYAVFSALIYAVNGQNITSSPFFLNNAVGAQTQVIIGLTSIIYSVCILLIPVIAFSVLKGEYGPVGGAIMGMLGTATQVGRLAQMASKASSGGGGGGGGAAAAMQQGNAGGGGSGTYRNLSVPPEPTPASSPAHSSSSFSSSKTIDGGPLVKVA